MMKSDGLTAMALIILLAGCGSAGEGSAPGPDSVASNLATAAASESPSATAVANLQMADGQSVGTATAVPEQGTVVLSLRAEGLPPGNHGVHLHLVGKCEGPKFESAGGHLNPGNRQHGLDNPQGQHAGDMPNLTVGQDGKGTISYTLKGGDIDAILDTDGSAMVIHAKADDQKTDPSGESGDRIACGVFSPG